MNPAMVFQQLYYTSCERGLAGYAGYQFNAVSSGATGDMMREVERFTVYEPADDTGAPMPLGRPVNLCYIPDAAGHPIVARVVPAGDDPSGRPGNYFAHALVPGAPSAWAETLPIQLWDAPFWREQPVEEPDLPGLPAPLPRGPLDRGRAAAWAGGRPQDDLARLLTAADRAVGGGGQVVLAGDDVTVAHAVAAISYLLAPCRARHMSFATYSRSAHQAPVHVVGVPPGPGVDGHPDLFDLVGGTCPDIEPHPLAERLVTTGIVAGEALWRAAVALAPAPPPDGGDLDYWHPVVVAAAVLRSGAERLPADDLPALARWLPDHGDGLAAADLTVLIRALLRTPGFGPDGALLAALHRTAGRAGASEACEEIEELLVLRLLDAPPGDGAPLERVAVTSERVRRTAAARVTEVLAGPAAAARPALGRALIAWAAESGVPLADEAVESYGHDVLAPLLLATSAAPDPGAAEAVRGDVVLQRGVARAVAALPLTRAAGLLDDPLGGLLTPAALVPFPALAEAGIVTAAGRGRDRIDALFEIIRLRRQRRGQAGGRAAAGPAHDLDRALLVALWPDGHGPGDVLRLLDELRPGVEVAPDVGDWLGEVLLTRPAKAERAGWRELARRMRAHRLSGLLPDPARRVVEEEAHYRRVRAGLTGRDGDPLRARDLAGVLAALDGVSPVVRDTAHAELIGEFLAPGRERELPGLLTGCPDDLFVLFCAEVAEAIAARNPDAALAAHVHGAAGETRLARSRPDRAEHLRREVLAPALRAWGRRDYARFKESLPAAEREEADARYRRDRPSLGERAGGLLGRLTGRGGDRRG
ncbi:hypothetical protein GCM10027294_37910 [Marinactinospora endophytica]